MLSTSRGNCQDGVVTGRGEGCAYTQVSIRSAVRVVLDCNMHVAGNHGIEILNVRSFCVSCWYRGPNYACRHVCFIATCRTAHRSCSAAAIAMMSPAGEFAFIGTNKNRNPADGGIIAIASSRARALDILQVWRTILARLRHHTFSASDTCRAIHSV